MHAGILLPLCPKWTLLTKVSALSVYLVSDKPQSRNQDVCHRWHRNLLMKTGCHGDCCQAGAQAVLWGRERDLARRGRSFISGDKEKETTRPAWTINSLPDTHAHTQSRGGGKKTHSVFPVIYKKSKVERVNLLALWHKQSWNTRASLQANQSAANEKGENTVCWMATKSKTSGNTETEMIYRFNDSAHYLF